MVVGHPQRATLGHWAGRTRREHIFANKTARIVMTMGMPVSIYRWQYGGLVQKLLTRNVLNFIGIKPVSHTLYGMVATSKPGQRDHRIKEMREPQERSALERRKTKNFVAQRVVTARSNPGVPLFSLLSQRRKPLGTRSTAHRIVLGTARICGRPQHLIPALRLAADRTESPKRPIVRKFDRMAPPRQFRNDIRREASFQRERTKLDLARPE